MTARRPAQPDPGSTTRRPGDHHRHLPSGRRAAPAVLALGAVPQAVRAPC
jgi:hypothetical protein